MRKFQQNLSQFERGDFYGVSRKIVLNEIIKGKDFSEFYLKKVKSFNCSLKSVSFRLSEADSLTFCNCQLINCWFGSADLYDVRYVNCQLSNVKFNATILTDFEFENCQLLKVSFGGSQADNLTIKNSTLKDIDCGMMTVLRSFSKNGIVRTEESQIQNYARVLTEFVKVKNQANTEYQDLISRSFKFFLFALGLEIL